VRTWGRRRPGHDVGRERVADGVQVDSSRSRPTVPLGVSFADGRPSTTEPLPDPTSASSGNWPPVAKAGPRQARDLRARAGQRRGTSRASRSPPLAGVSPLVTRAHRGAEVDASPAEMGRPLLVGRQAGLAPGIGHPGAFGVAGKRPLGGLLEQLARLVGSQRDAVCRGPRSRRAPPRRPPLLCVSTEPVGPSIAIELLPPYCVVLAPRKNVPTGAFEPRQCGLAARPAEFLRLQPLARVRAEPDGVWDGALDQTSRARSWPGSCGCRCSGSSPEKVCHDTVVVGGTAWPTPARPSGRGCRSHPSITFAPLSVAYRTPRANVLASEDERVPDANRHHLAVRAGRRSSPAVVALLGRVLRAPGAVVVGGEVAGEVGGVVVVCRRSFQPAMVVGEAVAVVVEVLARRTLEDEMAVASIWQLPERVDQVMLG